MCCENVAAQMGATLCSILFSVYCSCLLTPSSFPLFIIHWPLSFPNPQRDTPRLFISLLCVSWGWIPLDSISHHEAIVQSSYRQKDAVCKKLSRLYCQLSLCWSVERKSNVKILQSTIFHPFSIPEDYVLVQWLSKVGLWVCLLWSLVSYFIIEAIRNNILLLLSLTRDWY